MKFGCKSTLSFSIIQIIFVFLSKILMKQIMHYTLDAPLSINKTVLLPASKSISNRVLIITKLAQSTMKLENISKCDDTFVMERALKESSELTDIMGAGTAMRFLTAYFSVTPGRTMLTGTERMKHRPIDLLVNALLTLGANIKYSNEEGFPPLQIQGHALEGGEITLPGNVSSQFTSALLMIGPVLKSGLTIHLTGKIISRPYIDMTLSLMSKFGAVCHWTDDHTLLVNPTGYKPNTYRVENDWSAASYWYEIVALAPDAQVTLPALNSNSVQGDARVSNIFEDLGVSTTFGDEGIVLRKTAAKVGKIETDLENEPDLAQTLVVTCAMQKRPFKFTGLQNLRIKETDRLKALKTEMGKFGINLKVSTSGSVSWDGTSEDVTGRISIDTYEDHRMAMAFAPCCFRYPHLSVNNPEVVNKSYPKFWSDLEAAGFRIEN